MTRLALAWALVALWFGAVAWLLERRQSVSGQAELRLLRSGAEAIVATLIASLWFDTLGHGGWWVLFALLGLLVGVPLRLREVESGVAPTNLAALLVMADAGRYVAAGALLVWRLG